LTEMTAAQKSLFTVLELALPTPSDLVKRKRSTNPRLVNQI
jgi:hypothetical protein